MESERTQRTAVRQLLRVPSTTGCNSNNRHTPFELNLLEQDPLHPKSPKSAVKIPDHLENQLYEQDPLPPPPNLSINYNATQHLGFTPPPPPPPSLPYLRIYAVLRPSSMLVFPPPVGR